MELRIFLKNYLDNIFKKETERPQALQERGRSRDLAFSVEMSKKEGK